MFSLIVAVAENNCIGKNGNLPWHIPEDMQHFKQLTTGKKVIMGRKTWESLPLKFRPLPNRINIIITHQTHYEVPRGVLLYTSTEDAVRDYKNSDEEVMVIGGAKLYAELLPFAKKIYLTKVVGSFEGDAFFPNINLADWKETSREDHNNLSFITYERL